MGETVERGQCSTVERSSTWERSALCAWLLMRRMLSPNHVLTQPCCILLQVDLPWSKPPETVLLIKKPNSIDASQAFQQVANFLHIQKNMVSPKPPRDIHCPH